MHTIPIKTGRQAGRGKRTTSLTPCNHPLVPPDWASRRGQGKAWRDHKLRKARNLWGLDETSRGPPVRQTTPTAPQHVLSLKFRLPGSTSFGTLGADHTLSTNGGYIRQVFVQHGHLRAMSSCSRAATRKQHTTFLNKYTSGWQWRSQGNLTQLQRRMHFPAECDMQVHRPGIFPSVPTRHVLDDGRLSHMQQT